MCLCIHWVVQNTNNTQVLIHADSVHCLRSFSVLSTVADGISIKLFVSALSKAPGKSWAHAFLIVHT